MSKLSEKMARNLGLVPASQSVAFNIDPAQIQTIVDLINQLVAMFKGCKKTPEQAVQVAHKPAESDKRAVKKVVRQELGFVKNLFQGRKYVEAVLKTGVDTTVEDMKEVWNG